MRDALKSTLKARLRGTAHLLWDQYMLQYGTAGLASNICVPTLRENRDVVTGERQIPFITYEVIVVSVTVYLFLWTAQAETRTGIYIYNALLTQKRKTCKFSSCDVVLLIWFVNYVCRAIQTIACVLPVLISWSNQISQLLFMGPSYPHWTMKVGVISVMSLMRYKDMNSAWHKCVMHIFSVCKDHIIMMSCCYIFKCTIYVVAHKLINAVYWWLFSPKFYLVLSTFCRIAFGEWLCYLWFCIAVGGRHFYQWPA